MHICMQEPALGTSQRQKVLVSDGLRSVTDAVRQWGRCACVFMCASLTLQHQLLPSDTVCSTALAASNGLPLALPVRHARAGLEAALGYRA